MSFSLRTDHFQLCSEAVDEVVPSGVAPEEDEDDVEHEDEEAKRQLQEATPRRRGRPGS